MRALRYRESRHAVDAHRGEQQRNRRRSWRKGSSVNRSLANTSSCTCSMVRGIYKSRLRVHCIHGCRDALNHGCRIFRGPDADTRDGKRLLPEGCVDLRIVLAGCHGSSRCETHPRSATQWLAHALGSSGIICSITTRCRSGSIPFRNLLAKASLTMATLTLEALSASVKARPFTIRIPKVWK